MRITKNVDKSGALVGALIKQAYHERMANIGALVIEAMNNHSDPFDAIKSVFPSFNKDEFLSDLYDSLRAKNRN